MIEQPIILTVVPMTLSDQAIPLQVVPFSYEELSIYLNVLPLMVAVTDVNGLAITDGNGNILITDSYLYDEFPITLNALFDPIQMIFTDDQGNMLTDETNTIIQ